jgi:hypothetical protein
VTTDGRNWTDVEGGKEYTGNSDKNTVVSNKLTTPIKCKAIRILPWTWHKYIAMRSEVFVTI